MCGGKVPPRVRARARKDSTHYQTPLSCIKLGHPLSILCPASGLDEHWLSRAGRLFRPNAGCFVLIMRALIMRIFIAGAGGTLGRPVVRLLRALWHELIGLTRLGPPRPTLAGPG